ncbi:cell wall hydrolase [Altererythrobacter palmitatis]|uniref:cell wall hydrolase n=1 Tax=Alteraurantiacibacter palmitatis TaxID=2054628 RepID=UPI00301989EC
MRKAATRHGAQSRARAGRPPLAQLSTLYPHWQEVEPAEFTGRFSRVAQGRGLARKTVRRVLFKRVGVLLAAVAVPAMAAPDLPVAEPQVIRFAMPETIPYEPGAMAWTPPADQELAADPAALANDIAATVKLPDAGPAARPFTGFAGFADRLRAEDCLAMAIYYEAASESKEGQQAVAQVVMNRVRHPAWPNSVCGVVFQGSERQTGCQFTFTCDGSLARRPSAQGMVRARMIASAALGGFVFRPVGLATHYHRTDIYPYWAPSLHEVGTIGLHRFYRWSGAAGRPAAFSAGYAGNESIPRFNLVARAQGAAESAALLLPEIEAPAAARPAPAPLGSLPGPLPAPAAELPAAAERKAESTLLPNSGRVLDQHARSGQWLRQP